MAELRIVDDYHECTLCGYTWISDNPACPDCTDRGTPDQRAEREASTLGALPDGFRPTDVGNAERLIAAADGRLRYVHAWQRWIVYTEGRWTLDAADALVTEIAKGVARRLLTRAVNEYGEPRDLLWSWARRCETAASIANMVRLARGIPSVIVAHDELDNQPWLLNVANGTIDLRTGALRPHNPDDLITKQAPVTYDTTAESPLWAACVARWHPNEDVRAFLQRCTGSGATGHPVEALIVNVGPGGNGKSRYYGTIANVLGEYVVEPHKSLLVAQRHEQHPTVIASLHGARTLIASETEDGDRLDETQVKNLTGGDRLRARRMREDEWSFRPCHTAFLHTNYRPRIRGSDEGIWRRLKIVPWTVTIPKEERDEHLATKLADEKAGILNWIIAGCLEWQEHGLAEPETVLTATGDYRSSEDHIGRFLNDCCVLDPDRTISARDLRSAYEQWCQETGEHPWSARTVARTLTARGLDSARLGRVHTHSWIGIDLADESPASDTLRPHATPSAVYPYAGANSGDNRTKGSHRVAGNTSSPEADTNDDFF